MTVALTSRSGKELHVSEESVEFWVERGYRRASAPEATKAPAKKSTSSKSKK